MLDHNRNKTTRRTFIRTTAQLGLLASTAFSIPTVFAASTSTASRNQLTRDEFQDWMIFDGLAGFGDMNASPDEDVWTVSERIKKALTQSGLNCIRYTLRPVTPLYPGDKPLELAIKSIGDTYKWASLNEEIVMIPRSTEDILKAKAEGKLAITLCFQNSHVLGSNLDRIDMFRNLGVLTMQLTYNGKNQLGGGANVSGKIPLSKFGHEAVAKMNESKVLIDLSHSGERTCLEAIKASTSPVTISHSGCRALVDIPRNKTDEELRALADKGGVFGLYFMPFLASDSNARLEHLIEHINHAINICGEDHVSFGSDGATITGIDDLEAIRDLTAKFTQRRLDSGDAALGEKVGNVNFLPDLVGPNMFYKLATELISKGHKKSVVRKIMGDNAMRIAKEVWGA